MSTQTVPLAAQGTAPRAAVIGLGSTLLWLRERPRAAVLASRPQLQ